MVEFLLFLKFSLVGKSALSLVALFNNFTHVLVCEHDFNVVSKIKMSDEKLDSIFKSELISTNVQISLRIYILTETQRIFFLYLASDDDLTTQSNSLI